MGFDSRFYVHLDSLQQLVLIAGTDMSHARHLLEVLRTQGLVARVVDSFFVDFVHRKLDLFALLVDHDAVMYVKIGAALNRASCSEALIAYLLNFFFWLLELGPRMFRLSRLCCHVFPSLLVVLWRFRGL